MQALGGKLDKVMERIGKGQESAVKQRRGRMGGREKEELAGS